MNHEQSEVVTFTRNELYEKIWNTPTIKLARDFGLPMLRSEKYVKSIRFPNRRSAIGPSSRTGKPGTRHILKRTFDAVPAKAFEDLVAAVPLGIPSRRIWFLYELLTAKTLDVPDAQNVAAINVLDPKAYFTAKPQLSRRHRGRDNLLGTGNFCPVIRRTKTLTRLEELALAEKARETVGRTGAHLVSRAAGFLLLADSRASFEIEGERPPRNRLERWGRAVMQAGRNKLTIDEIIRLHRILIEDSRFVQPGFRQDGVFLGGRDHNGDPLPEFIGARPADIPALMDGLLAANERMGEAGLDAVLQAAATAFGFVYIPPLQDGNG